LLPASVRSYLRFKLSRDPAFLGREELLESSIDEYVRFMCLIRRQQVEAMRAKADADSSTAAPAAAASAARFVPLSPSRLVDLVWHTHILHTREYIDMCTKHFDAKFVHHVPSTGVKDASERVEARRSYEHTLAVYERCFGHQAPAEVWPTRSIDGAAPTDDDDCRPEACNGSPGDECNANCQWK